MPTADVSRLKHSLYQGAVSRVITTVFLLASLGSSPVIANTHRQVSRRSRHIDALAKAPRLVTYFDDGAADATVTEVGSNDMGIVDNPIPEVRDIVNLRAAAIPLLIAHLDDTRLTSARFDANNPKPVPLGHVCLDILTSTIRAPKTLVDDCADDGLGACVRKGYYFRPDAYKCERDKCVAKIEVRKAKLRWQKAYRHHRIRFQYPRLWRARARFEVGLTLI